MYCVHKSIDIDFAHHIRGHRGACINIHGHTWKFEVGLAALTLDVEGFVVDFGRLKREVLKPCHELLDHSLAIGAPTYEEVAPMLEPLGSKLIASRQAVHGNVEPEEPQVIRMNGAENRYRGGMKVAVFPFSPTSERLARWLYDASVATLEDDRVKVRFARIYETMHPVEAVAEYAPADLRW